MWNFVEIGKAVVNEVDKDAPFKLTVFEFVFLFSFTDTGNVGLLIHQVNFLDLVILTWVVYRYYANTISQIGGMVVQMCISDAFMCIF